MSSIEECLRKASHCERIAKAAANDPAKATYLAAAATWRRLAATMAMSEPPAESLTANQPRLDSLAPPEVLQQAAQS